MMKTTAAFAAALLLSAVAAATSPLPPQPPSPPESTAAAGTLTLDALLGERLAGAWSWKMRDPNGAAMDHMIWLKADGTYSNAVQGTTGDGVPISAMGQGLWRARLGAGGELEIVLGYDPTEANPRWVATVMADGTLAEGDGKVWTRTP